MSQDVAAQKISRPLGTLKSHPLEEWMVPPGKWTEDKLSETAKKFMNLLEVYIEDSIAISKTRNVHNLQHISRWGS